MSASSGLRLRNALSTIPSGIGWWLGDFIGLTTAVFLSIVGTAAGAYFGRKIAREYFS